MLSGYCAPIWNAAFSPMALSDCAAPIAARADPWRSRAKAAAFAPVVWLDAGSIRRPDYPGTMGGSYCGSDQSTLATLNPPHLSTMIVAVGASNYYHCSMRQNGALEQRFMIYAFRMATTSKEALADPDLKAALDRACANVGEWVARAPLKKGTSPLCLLPNYEQWVIDLFTHGGLECFACRGYRLRQPLIHQL